MNPVIDFLHDCTNSLERRKQLVRLSVECTLWLERKPRVYAVTCASLRLVGIFWPEVTISATLVITILRYYGVLVLLFMLVGGHAVFRCLSQVAISRRKRSFDFRAAPQLAGAAA